ncbi:hypothetical protein MSG28_009105 [Choristoneura fumiferana]|uniref:Uncharacterized protein n=1 Tax=Choristoneura fumiferana TaxID=7141 RepID=A0ACC0KX66_CHOFU|nr:hypothetical protein MSG28_009105 [Choristoneura fumiferana]
MGNLDSEKGSDSLNPAPVSAPTPLIDSDSFIDSGDFERLLVCPWPIRLGSVPRLSERTFSLWGYMANHLNEYKNPLYNPKAHPDALKPDLSAQSIRQKEIMNAIASGRAVDNTASGRRLRHGLRSSQLLPAFDPEVRKVLQDLVPPASSQVRSLHGSILSQPFYVAEPPESGRLGLSYNIGLRYAP